MLVKCKRACYCSAYQVWLVMEEARGIAQPRADTASGGSEQHGSGQHAFQPPAALIKREHHEAGVAGEVGFRPSAALVKRDHEELGGAEAGLQQGDGASAFRPSAAFGPGLQHAAIRAGQHAILRAGQHIYQPSAALVKREHPEVGVAEEGEGPRSATRPRLAGGQHGDGAGANGQGGSIGGIQRDYGTPPRYRERGSWEVPGKWEAEARTTNTKYEH